MSPPVLSVLINNYNYGAFVGRAIDSVLAQASEGVEVVVVDDGSTDDSAARLAPYADRVRLVFQANGGQAAAINAAVRESRGAFLCFLDADDWWLPGKLDAVRKAFRESPDAALVYHRLQPTLSDGEQTLRPIPRALCSGDLAPRLTRAGGCWPFPMTSSLAVRRALWDEVGDIPDSFRISADAWLTGLYPFLGAVVALPAVLGAYRIHSNAWYRAADDAAMLRRRMAHWAATVAETNAFLAARERPERLNLADHYPHRLAAARLAGAAGAERLALAVAGLRFAGEPNPLRRLRDVLRDVPALPSRARQVVEAAR